MTYIEQYAYSCRRLCCPPKATLALDDYALWEFSLGLDRAGLSEFSLGLTFAQIMTEQSACVLLPKHLDKVAASKQQNFWTRRRMTIAATQVLAWGPVDAARAARCAIKAAQRASQSEMPGSPAHNELKAAERQAQLVLNMVLDLRRALELFQRARQRLLPLTPI